VTQSDKRFLWCNTDLCEERDSTGASVTKRFFGQGEQISDTSYFLTRDHLGSVRETTDGTGTLRDRYEYDTYGKRIKLLSEVESDFAFTGHYIHIASGLDLTLFRAYDTDVGRWISRDPIEEQGGLNLYAYVGGNPVNYVDPNGDVIVVIAAIVGGAIIVASMVAYLSSKKDYYTVTKPTSTDYLEELTKRHDVIPNNLIDLADTAKCTADTLGGTSATLKPPTLPDSLWEAFVDYYHLGLGLFVDWSWNQKNQPKTPNPQKNPNSLIYLGPKVSIEEQRKHNLYH
jgi:RHS repeat-associated protein